MANSCANGRDFVLTLGDFSASFARGDFPALSKRIQEQKIKAATEVRGLPYTVGSTVLAC